MVTLARSLSYMSSELGKLQNLESALYRLSTELTQLKESTTASPVNPDIIEPPPCDNELGSKPVDGALRLSKLTRYSTISTMQYSHRGVWPLTKI